MSLALWNPKIGTSSHRIWPYSGMILGLSRGSSQRSAAFFDNTGFLRTTGWWCNCEVAPETQEGMAALLFGGKHTNRALSPHPTLKIYLSSPSTILRHKCLVGLRCFQENHLPQFIIFIPSTLFMGIFDVIVLLWCRCKFFWHTPLFFVLNEMTGTVCFVDDINFCKVIEGHETCIGK